MTREEMKRILILLTLLALAGCGGNMSGGSGIALKVMSVGGFSSNAEHGRIDKYRVTVTGEGIESPIEAEFPGDAEEGVIQDIPTGEDRTVEVRALNPNEVAIREGEAYEVKVGGGITEVPITLEAVPIFTNIAAGNTVENTRLVFKVFSDPINPVIVEEQIGAGFTPMIDASTSLAELYLDQSTGLGRIAPALMEPGERVFAVRDLVTGRMHRAGVTLVDGTGRRPAPIVPGGVADANVMSCSAFACAP
jgi:hypothetical protein